MCGRIANEGATKEDGDPPGGDDASKHADGDAKAAGDEDAVEEDKDRQFGKSEGRALKEGGGVERLSLTVYCEYSGVETNDGGLLLPFEKPRGGQVSAC